MDSIQLKRLAGIPVDLSKPENAAKTIRTPGKLVEAAKVPQHRGELSPKTKDTMRARVNHAKKALEALETARDELMDLPAVDYMEDIPTLIKQLHKMLHGEDGTGGVHHLHRHYKHEFDSTTFPEDIEEEKRKEEEEAAELEAGVTDADKEEGKKKKKTNEAFSLSQLRKPSNPAPSEEGKSDGLGFEKATTTPAVEKKNVSAFKLAPGSQEKTMFDCPKGQEDVVADAGDAKGEHVTEAEDKDSEDGTYHEHTKSDGKKVKVFVPAKKPRGEESEEEEQSSTHKEHKVEAVCADCKKDPCQCEAAIKDAVGDSVNEAKTKIKRCPDCGEFGEIRGHMTCASPSDAEEDCSVTMSEGGTPLFARDAYHPNHGTQERYSSWTTATKPVNVVDDSKPSIYYPNGAKNESPNQLATNPYNENQKVRVPPAIKNVLKEQAEEARKLAETFNMRKDWDSKNFHETLANAFETLVNFLNKETVYGIKEAQVFMTSLMSPLMNKIPPEVIKYIAAGGTLRSLKSYVNDVKEPHTGTVFQQDSDGVQK